jgi:macrolide-specific efflux system membrane fusion protein
VLVDVDNRDRQLMTGMSTQMFFVLGSAKGVPIIPLEALGKRVPAEDGKSGQAYQVRTKEGGAVVEKTIHVGLMNRSVVEVRDGISVGDEVATSTNKAADDKKRGGGFTRGPRL